jgi:AbrB family looped-hinge helix DNA binding protein
MEQATVSEKFQIVIPKRIREAMGLKAGQKLGFVQKGHLITLVPLREIEWLRGRFAGADPSGYRDRSDLES